MTAKPLTVVVLDIWELFGHWARLLGIGLRSWDDGIVVAGVAEHGGAMGFKG